MHPLFREVLARQQIFAFCNYAVKSVVNVTLELQKGSALLAFWLYIIYGFESY